jgi:hypothetical protein
LIEGSPKGSSPPTTPKPSGTSDTSSPRHSNYFDLSYPSSLDVWEEWRHYSLRVFVRTFRVFTGFQPQGEQLQKRFNDAFPEWTRSYDPLIPGPHFRVVDLIASPGDEDRPNSEVYDRYLISTTVRSITQTDTTREEIESLTRLVCPRWHRRTGLEVTSNPVLILTPPRSPPDEPGGWRDGGESVWRRLADSVDEHERTKPSSRTGPFSSIGKSSSGTYSTARATDTGKR